MRVFRSREYLLNCNCTETHWTNAQCSSRSAGTLECVNWCQRLQHSMAKLFKCSCSLHLCANDLALVSVTRNIEHIPSRVPLGSVRCVLKSPDRQIYVCTMYIRQNTIVRSFGKRNQHWSTQHSVYSVQVVQIASLRITCKSFWKHTTPG